ncbi:hypothetical protein ACFL2V_11760 [Pseudomonadota bacterium]
MIINLDEIIYQKRLIIILTFICSHTISLTKQTMKLHFSISLKLTIIVVAVSAAVIFTLTIYNINEQAIDYENIFVDKAKDIAVLFDITLTQASNRTYMEQSINQTYQKNEQIQSIDIYLENQEKTEVIYSTNSSHLQIIADKYINLSIQTKKQVKIPKLTDTTHLLTVITPTNTSSVSNPFFIVYKTPGSSSTARIFMLCSPTVPLVINKIDVLYVFASF